MAHDRVLVTGASGFVGSALVSHLAAQGRSVIATARRGQSTQFGQHVEICTGHDFAADTDWRSALEGVSTIVHCAARVHQLHDSAHDPLLAFRAVNRDGTLHMARQAVQSGVRRLIFVSTIGVNGASTDGQPFTAMSTPNPHSPYAVSKWEAERGLQELSAATGLELAIVRPPMVIGANAPGNVERLMRLLDRGLPLPLGTVDNRRSFVALDNLVGLLAHLVHHPAAAGTWLVSDGEDLSTAQLLRAAARALGRPARLFPFPTAWLGGLLRAAGKPDLVASLLASLQIDSQATRSVLGWTPPVTTLQAVEQAASAYRARHAARR